MVAAVRLGTVPLPEGLAVPAEALIRMGTGERVVLALGDERFRPVPVEAGITVGDRVQIRDGLKEGDRVEIGRASCRERVCQYVEISVGAVLLKTKTKTTTKQIDK